MLRVGKSFWREDKNELETFMRRIPAKLWLLLISLCLFISMGASVEAKKLDLTLARFVQCHGPDSYCHAHNVAYERFMTEYTFSIAPRALSPASTLGYSGFYIGFENSIVVIPSGSALLPDSNATAADYEAARWRIGSGEYNALPPVMYVPSIHVRKGLPWSFEVGANFSNLAYSNTILVGADVKWSLFEGYRKGVLGAFPDIAVRGAVNQAVGQSDANMTMLGVDGSISYHFGMGGTISLEPYAGFQYLWTFLRPEQLLARTEDATIDYLDATPGSYDLGNAALTKPDLERAKIFAGFVFRFEMLAVTMDFAWGLPREWKTTEFTGDPTNPALDSNGRIVDWESATAKVDTQFMFSFGVAAQF